MPSSLRAPAPPAFIDDLIELNQRMGERMQELLLDYIDRAQRIQVDASRYDLFDWYRRLAHKEGANAAWYSMIYIDVTRLADYNPDKPLLIDVMDKELADEVRRYPVPEPETRP